MPNVPIPPPTPLNSLEIDFATTEARVAAHFLTDVSPVFINSPHPAGVFIDLPRPEQARISATTGWPRPHPYALAVSGPTHRETPEQPRRPDSQVSTASTVPDLTPAEMERLALLAEECSEVIHTVTKILRHGYESGSPYRITTNREDLEIELGQLLAEYDRLEMNGDIDPDDVEIARERRRSQVITHHQET